MTSCETNCNPVTCPEPICNSGLRDKYKSGQVSKGCPVIEFNGNGASQPIYVVTTCIKEVQAIKSDGTKEKRVQKCSLPCAAGQALDIFVAANN